VPELRPTFPVENQATSEVFDSGQVMDESALTERSAPAGML